MQAKAKAQTLSAKIHDAILEMIIDAGSASENMLLTEHDLVVRFGVSKAPVREALLRLCAEEVLNSIPRCGYVVVRLGEKSGRDNLAVRRMLELSALEMGFDAFTPERVEEIATNLAESHDAIGEQPTVWEVWEDNLAFHCDLMTTYGNPYLVKHLKQCMEVERRFYAQNHYSASRQFAIRHHPEAHQHILQAIREGDKQRALHNLKQDIADDPFR